MDKTIKELYVSPELESLEMKAESVICSTSPTSSGSTDAPSIGQIDWDHED